MTPEETHNAARLIWEKWDADELLDELPEDCRPQTELEAHAIQSVFPRVSGQPQAGWKSQPQVRPVSNTLRWTGPWQE